MPAPLSLLLGCRLLLGCLIGWAVLVSPALAARLDLRLELGNHAGAVRRVAVSADQRLLLTVGDDKTARLWDADSRQALAVLRVPVGDGLDGQLYGAAFSPDGSKIVVGGTMAGTLAGSRLFLFETGSGRPAGTLALPAGEVKRLVWTRGNQIAACLAAPGALVVLSADGAVRLRQPLDAPCFALAEHPDGSLWAGAADGRLRRYVPEGGGWRADREIALDQPDVRSIAISPDGVHIAAGFFDARIRLPNGQTSESQVQVVDAATGQTARRFGFSDIEFGSYFALAWSRDGTVIAASGRGNQRGFRRFPLKRVAWPSGEVRTDVIAGDTVFDLAPIGAADFIAATAEPGWARISASGPAQSALTQVSDLRGAESLRVSPDGLSIGLGVASSARMQGPSGRPEVEPRRFDLATRTLSAGGLDLPGPRRFSFRVSVSRWENHRAPLIGGREQPMQPAELSRAVVVAADSAAAYLGTTKTLRRIDPSGHTRWSVSVPTEVTAVGLDEAGTRVVAALLDGTAHWWHAETGRLLLSFFVSPDGRWVLWTPEGYYDASAGGETLIGWTVSRPDGADFHSIGRFRERFHRPDVIDRVVVAGDTAVALAQANAARRVALARADEPELRADVEASIAPPPPVEQILPPALILASERGQRSGAADLRISFALRADGLPADRLVVRLDGRPAIPAQVTLPARQDGQTLGEMVLTMPPRNAQVTVIAASGEVYSDPARVDYRYEAPPQTPSEAATVQAAAGAPAGAAPAQSVVLPGAPSAAGAPAAPSAAVAPAAPGTPAGSTASAAATAPRGRLYMLAVGVADYASPEITDLRLSAKDALDFASAMRDTNGRPYEAVDVRLLTDAQATRAKTLEGLAWLRASVGPQDTGMVYFAGHGTSDAAGNYHFITHDTSLDRLVRTAISGQAIRQTLVQLRGRALLFIDTCYSGAVVGRGGAAGNDSIRLTNTLSSPEHGVVVLSASTGRQEALESDKWGNGAFTRALLEGLRGGADRRREGLITHQALGDFVGEVVRKITGGRQTPVYAAPNGVSDYALAAIR